ncbi:MAG: T9SS type A sorting domain-containing protein [Ignavibacteriales bacterium]|nr:T9SS type A sorting domain-containing protein [Ignavibacteriales bacterium]MCF8306614.1 T9SS type A sorting domain-containing protein [Ignavibacteriales bacterium]MCF8316286.1 T9SS type A sorting domain-containing protein [Ignavibacteriales bacterium]MCF8437870.1 T9SS type A sorting domain-containing protein [Ignavibacteriales bacterium]
MKRINNFCLLSVLFVYVNMFANQNLAAVVNIIEDNSILDFDILMFKSKGAVDFSTSSSGVTSKSETNIELVNNYALAFNGSDAYVNCGSGSSFDINGDKITIEALINTADIDQPWQAIAGKQIDGYGYYGLILDSDTRKPALYLKIGGTWAKRVIASQELSANTWYHIAAVYDGSLASIYINGKLNASNACAGSLSSDLYTPFYIGMNNNVFFNGKIDEVRLWNTARTQEQIIRNMYKELTGAEENLASYFKMSDGSGATLTNNKSGAANNGIIIGAAWSLSSVFTDPRQALEFDGTDDCVSLSSDFSAELDNLANFSMCGWIFPTQLDDNNWGTIFSRKSPASNWPSKRFGIWQLPNNVYSQSDDIYIVISNPDSTYLNYNGWIELYTTTNVLRLNEWNHLAVVFDGTKAGIYDALEIYVNGKSEVYTGADVGWFQFPYYLSSGFESVYLGKYENGSYFKGGNFDEFSFWNISLTEDQVREIMCRNLSGNEPGLFAYYRFDQYDGTTLYDATSNEYDGTLTNMEAATDWVASTAYNTWTGAESSDWSTPGNWSRGLVPSATDNVGLYKWDLGNEITISGNPTINNIWFSSGASPAFSSDLTVNGIISLGKDINFGSSKITLGENGYLYEGNYRFYGTNGTITTTRNFGVITDKNIAGLGAVISAGFEQMTVSNAEDYWISANGNYIFSGVINGKNAYSKSGYDMFYDPSWGGWRINVSGTNYAFLNISTAEDPPASGWNYYDRYWGQWFASNLSVEETTPVLGNTTITRGHSGHLNSIYRYYNIESNNNSLLSKLVFNYNENELHGLTESNLDLYGSTDRLTWNPFVWTQVDATANTVTWVGEMNYSYFTAGDKYDILPVELISFSAKVFENKVRLTWQTATEQNNYGFEIERALSPNDGDLDWEKIGFVPGHGNSNSPKLYFFNDDSLIAEPVRNYRLKQIDTDGKFEYSSVVSIDMDNILTKVFELSQNYPNPFNPSTNISYEIPKEGLVKLKVYDILGNEITTLINEVQKPGVYNAKWYASGLSSGIYFYRLTSGSFTETKKMMLVR